MPLDIIVTFHHLLDKVYDILFKENLGVNHAEPIFLKIMLAMRKSKEIKYMFLKLSTREIVDPPAYDMILNRRPRDFVDGDLICYIAHATRWGEFRDACVKRELTVEHKTLLPGSVDFSDRVTSALKDDWEDQEFYVYFGNEQKVLGQPLGPIISGNTAVSIRVAFSELASTFVDCLSVAELDLIYRFSAVKEYGLALQLLINFLTSNEVTVRDSNIAEKFTDLSRMMHMENQFDFSSVLRGQNAEISSAPKI